MSTVAADAEFAGEPCWSCDGDDVGSATAGKLVMEAIKIAVLAVTVRDAFANEVMIQCLFFNFTNLMMRLIPIH